MKSYIAALVAGAVLAGCSPVKTAEPPPASAAAPPPAPGFADVQAAPLCDAEDGATPLAPTVREKGCRVPLGDRIAHVRFTAPSGDPEQSASEDGIVRVALWTGAGQPVQTFEETGVSRLGFPSAEDVVGDDAPELLILRDVGNVNAVEGLWVRTATGQYARAGEIAASGPEKTADGLLALPARSSADSWEVSFGRLVNGQLETVARVTVTATVGAGGAVTGACSLGEAPGLGGLGLNRAQAEAKFCAEPAAKVYD